MNKNKNQKELKEDHKKRDNIYKDFIYYNFESS